jgi:CheY-like chemotaxis protein
VALLETVLAEVRAVRRGQEQILGLLKARPGVSDLGQIPDQDLGDEGEALLTPVRHRRHKTLVLIDDDPATRAAAVTELEQAEVPVRACADGQAGIEAIAREKPDLIVLELDLSGDMAGKDVINVIKATMEWVDIPIVLYTRARLETQREVRTVHGADEFVLKGSGPAALVSRVISVFRRA